jgi:hypothetical protein
MNSDNSLREESKYMSIIDESVCQSLSDTLAQRMHIWCMIKLCNLFLEGI